MEKKVMYNGQLLTLTRFWATEEPCLRVTNPQQINIFLKNLTKAELEQITSLDGSPLDITKELCDI